MADLTVLTDAQVRVLRRAVDEGITPTVRRWGGCSIRTLQALARKNCVHLVYGRVVDEDGRRYRSIVAGDVTVCGLRALERAETARRETAEREARARRIPRQVTRDPFAALVIDETRMADAIDAAFGPRISP